MGNANACSPEEIRRRTEEFEIANHRDHRRFVLGAIFVALLMIGGVLLALAD